MSTLLKTAAMGLLSKTLQTLLNKYLLEVDVEGVAMPSLIDLDGQSGWGVRLCNVRLREGVELMTLPGKRKVIKKRRKRMQRNSTRGSVNVKTTTTTTGGDDLFQERVVSSNDCNETDQATKEYQRKPFDTDNDVETELFELLNDQQEVNRSARLMSEEDMDMQSALSSRVPSPSFVCRSSTVRSAVTGCLSRGRKDSNREVHGDEEELVSPSTSTSQNGMPSMPSLPNSLLDQNVVFDTQNLVEEYSLKPKALYKPISDDDDDFDDKDVIVESVAGPDNRNEQEMGQGDNDYGDDDEEAFAVEEDMVLFLGKAGRIGTLDVRLVGKELHIMVEDAFLSVEACPKQQDELDDTSTKTASTADTTKDDGSRVRKKDIKKQTKGPPKKEGETPGERLLENSLLARAINTIPHLLLRDVHVQLILRNKAQETDGEFHSDVGPEDSMVEICVEMLSVASGEDFLENFGNNDSDSKTSANLDDSKSNASTRQRVSLQVLEERDENEYLFKRIRTGKGPDGGISIKVYPPNKNKKIIIDSERMKEWAYHSYNTSAQFCLFRCSGLDIRTRIFLGKQKEVAIRNNDYAWYGDEYDEYTMDSMLFGVDYIAPTTPPLPPLNKKDSFSTTAKKTKPDVECFVTDENGIQSNSIQSCFHKVARGLTPVLCSKDHLPSEHCPYCWKDNARPNSFSEHPLDSRTPLPGIVCNIEFAEPIEINVDRGTLEVIGSILPLFSKKADDIPTRDSEASMDDAAPEKTSITEKIKNLAFRKKDKKEVLRAAFPSFMKPETIEMVGLYIGRVVLRVHMMKNDGIYDQGLAFRYWEATLQCTTADIQTHNSKEKSFHDVRCDLGYLLTNDCFGIERKRLVSIGIPLRDSDDSLSLSQIRTNTAKEHTCWPNTAAILLQVPMLSNVSEYESHEGHAVQIRILSVGGSESDTRSATMNARIGILNVDLPCTLPSEIETMIRQVEKSLFGVTSPQESAPVERTNSNNMMPTLIKYALKLDGGHFSWSPLVHVRLPMLKVSGDVSSNNNFFLETMLNHVKLQYGNQTTEKQTSQMSLSYLAQLPEDVRTRILFFLNDLGPIERALGIKRERNSFLRCRAVNKGIVKAAKRSIHKTMKRPKKIIRVPSDQRPNRQGILDEFSKLDEQALAELWATHKSRAKARLNRTRLNSDR